MIWSEFCGERVTHGAHEHNGATCLGAVIING